MVWWTLMGEASKQGMKKIGGEPNQTKFTYDSLINTTRNSPGGGERMTATRTD